MFAQVFVRADPELQQDMAIWRRVLSLLADAEPSTCSIFLAAAAAIPPKPIMSLRFCLSSRASSQELHAFMRATLIDMLRGAVRRGGGSLALQSEVRSLQIQRACSIVAKR